MNQLNHELDYNPRNLRGGGGSAWRIYARLLRYVWDYKWKLTLAIVFSLAVAASFGAMLLSMGKIATLVLDTDERIAEAVERDAANIAKNSERMRGLVGWAPEGLDTRYRSLVAGMRANRMRAMWIASVTMIALSILIAVARYLQEYFAGAIGASISVRLAREMFENILTLSHRFFESQPSGEIMARFTNDIFMINRGLSGVFVKMLREPFKVVVFIAIALRTDWVLTLIGLCVLPPVAYVIIAVGKKVRKSVRRSLEKIASMATVLHETVAGITIVKAFSMERYEIERLRAELRKLRRYLLQMVRADAAVGPLTEVTLMIGFAGFVMAIAYRVDAGELAPGGVLALCGSLALTLDPVRKLSTVNNQVQTSVASAERVFEFIDLEPDLAEAPGAREFPPIERSLRFEGVRFAYTPGAEVLRGITFEARKGEMIALVGFSGAGKSTVAKLIPRFYDVDAGRITLDGADIREATFRSLRGQIGIVTQELLLFNLSVRDNIAFGEETFSQEQIERAAKAAHAHEFILKLPQGYDTFIGEGGAALSGGQRQRLALARALIKNPGILILDEATSSLDSESERAIQEALAEFTVGRTTIVIAHRLSTVQRADRILVLDEGRIAEEGTHAELLEQGGLYKRLYETQLAPAAPRE